MIKFFRRIRQQLVSQNKFSKYMLYAIGEVVLVVIGILIALQINNANEAQKIRHAERSYLVRLAVDLEENKILWNKRYTSEEKRLEAANAFINYSFSDDKDVKSQVLPYFNAASTWDDLHINQVTFKEMVSSGNFDLISNDSIKFKLQDLEKLYQSILNRWDKTKEDILKVMSNIIVRKINFLYSYPIDPGQQQMLTRTFTKEEKEQYMSALMKRFSILLEDELFMNMMTLINTNTPSLLTEYKQADAKVTELIDLIKINLKTDD